MKPNCKDINIIEQENFVNFFFRFLGRMEFIVSNHIKAHPMALVHPEKLTQEELQQIKKLIKPYDNGPQYFVEKLAQGKTMVILSKCVCHSLILLSIHQESEPYAPRSIQSA